MNYIAKNIYFVTNNMPRSHGGRTKSMLQRARLLTSVLSNNVYILTTRYNNDYWIIWDDFQRRKLINNKVHCINLYHDLMLNRYSKGNNNIINELISFKFFKENTFVNILDIIQNAFNMSSEIISEEFIIDGFSVKLQYRDSLLDAEEKRLYSIRVIDNISLDINIEFFLDHNNNLIRTCRYNENGLLVSERFVDRVGTEYFNKRYEYQDGKRKMIDMLYYNGIYNKGDTKVFKSYRQLYAFWFKNVMSSNSFVICDVRNYDRALTDVRSRSRGMYLTCLFHSNHQSSSAYKYIIDNHDKLDKIITLTERQYEDLKNIIPSKKMSVVPHSIEIPNLINANERRNFVVLSRLAKSKQIDHIFHAFQQVVIKDPNVILDLYGDGDQEEELKELAINLNIDDNVIFHGKTETPFEVFQQSKCSIVASKFEGFALTIEESLANGCPVVSYDLKYGPSDMIQHGINGFLVEEGDIEGLANKLKLIASNKISFDEKSIQASMKNFTHDKFIENWLGLFEESVSF